MHRTGMVIIGPLVAAGVIAWGVSLDDGSNVSVVTFLWLCPAMMILLGFCGLFAGAIVGSVGGWLVGTVWGRDLDQEGLEMFGAGGALGGVIGGFGLALYYLVR